MSEFSIFPPEMNQQIHRAGVIAVLVVDRVEDGVPLAEALFAGGIRAMELTLRTPVALKALKEIRSRVPQMLAGVGTVLTPDQLRQARDAGAAFGVSPGVNPRVLRTARDEQFPFAPGVITPSDIELALEHGCDLLKFFPAEPGGGMNFLRAMAAPYASRGLRFIPLGGLNARNIRPYLSDPLISALGGSWLAPQETVASQDWGRITMLATEACRIVQEVRAKLS